MIYKIDINQDMGRSERVGALDVRDEETVDPNVTRRLDKRTALAMSPGGATGAGTVRVLGGGAAALGRA